MSEARAEAFRMPKPNLATWREVCRRCGAVNLRPSGYVRKFCSDTCRLTHMSERMKAMNQARQA